jgi:hypothetical protein
MILDQLLFEIRQSIPSSSHMSVLASDDSHFTIQLGRSHDAVVTVTLQDSARPTFAVTYPALVQDREGGESVREKTISGILSSGVSWIVRKVFRFGFVPPEGYRCSSRNSGRPEKL